MSASEFSMIKTWQSETKKSAVLIITMTLICVTLIIWSNFAVLEEVTTGQGKVITWSRSQVIQSRDGGVIRKLLVREGDNVTVGQQLAIMDATRFQAGYDEIGSRVKSLAVNLARLQSEIFSNAGKNIAPKYCELLRKYSYADNRMLITDEEINTENKDIIDHEQSLLMLRRKALNDSINGLKQSRKLAENELNLTIPLVRSGAVSQVEELRLRREVTDLTNKLNETSNQWYEQTKEEMVKKKTELDSLFYQQIQRQDQLTGTVIASPVTGVVKDVQATTLGGVIEPGGKLMEVVPSEDQLLIEVKINPRDIAFIHPGQSAVVKISAYDASIYGSMSATVERISPDTLQDQTQRDKFYYQVYVRTDKATLETKDGKQHQIVPGMIATADIVTGKKSVIDYLVKPLNKAKEALRER